MLLYTNANTAKAPNIKHTSPEVKDVCYFAERVRHMLGVKIITATNKTMIIVSRCFRFPNEGRRR